MGTTSTRHALPRPEGTDPNDVPQDLLELTDRLDAVLYPAYTTVERDALAAEDRPLGKIIRNTTTDRYEVSNGDGTWSARQSNVELKNYNLTKATNASATGAVAVSHADGNEHQLTLTGNTTISITNPPAAGKVGKITLYLTQDATGGRTVTWPVAVKWPSATAPTLTLTANKTDVIVLVTFDGGVTYFGMVAGQNL